MTFVPNPGYRCIDIYSKIWWFPVKKLHIVQGEMEGWTNWEQQEVTELY